MTTRRVLFAILALALACRAGLLIAFWLTGATGQWPDTPSYIGTAVSLARNGSFEMAGTPELIRTPGYPAFLAMCRIAGTHWLQLAQALQVLLDIALVYLTYLLGKRIAGVNAGLAAAAFQALSVAAIVSSVSILSDGLFAILLTAALLLLIRFLKTGGNLSVALAASLTAAAAYVRPIGLLFIVIGAFALALRVRPWRAVAIFCCVSAALVAPWYVRNYVETGFAGFSSVSEHTLLFTQAAALEARVRNVTEGTARTEIQTRYEQQLRQRQIAPGSAGAERLKGEMARRILSQHPLLAFWLYASTSHPVLLPSGTGILEQFGITSGNRGTLAVLHSSGLWSAAKHYFGSNTYAAAALIPELIVLALQYLACLVFVAYHVSRRGPRLSSVSLLAVLTVAALCFPGPGSVPRYRVPVEPLLNAAAGAGVLVLMNRFRRKAGSVRMAATATSPAMIEEPVL